MHFLQSSSNGTLLSAPISRFSNSAAENKKINEV